MIIRNDDIFWVPRHINDFSALLHYAWRQQLEWQMRFNKSLLCHFGEKLKAGHRDFLNEIHFPLFIFVVFEKRLLHLVVHVEMEPGGIKDISVVCLTNLILLSGLQPQPKMRRDKWNKSGESEKDLKRNSCHDEERLGVFSAYSLKKWKTLI